MIISRLQFHQLHFENKHELKKVQTSTWISPLWQDLLSPIKGGSEVIAGDFVVKSPYKHLNTSNSQQSFDTSN